MSLPCAISVHMQSLLEKELHTGENVIWCEQPRPTLFVLNSSPYFVFGVFFLLIAFSIGFHSKAFELPLFFMSIIGAIFALSPIWTYWSARHTVYVITNQRAIRIVAPWQKTIHSFVGAQLIDIHRVEDAYGRGNIIFHRQIRKGAKGSEYYYDIGFIGLQRVHDVENMIRDLYAKTNAT